MNKHNTQSTLNTFVFITIALSSGCGAITTVPSPTSTPASAQTPSETTTPSPLNTSETIHPEGKLIYYKENAVYSLDLQTHITSIIFSTGWPQYNPIFINNFYYFTNGGDVFRVNIYKPLVEQITLDIKPIYFYDISPDNKYLAYTDQLDQEIAILDIENNASAIIPQAKGYEYSSPSWSPNSKSLLYFESPKTPIKLYGRLFLYSFENEKAIELLPEKGIYLIAPKWSPDGKNIVLNMADSQTGKPGIYLLNLESNNINLIEENATGNKISWSPMGDKILYLNDQLTLFESSNKTEIIAKSTKDRSVLDATWSPDGKFIGYLTCSMYTVNSGPNQGFRALDSCIFTIKDIVTNDVLDIEIPITRAVFWIHK